MKTIVFCAIVIAGSTFTMAVEDVYGWSKVSLQAETAWGYANKMGTELMGNEARAEVAVETQQAPGSVASE